MHGIILHLIIGLSLITDPTGLKIGQKAPDFNGTDQFGKNINLYETLKNKNVIVTFYRGAWCRYCMGQFKDYQDSLSLFNYKGAVIIAVSPEHEDGIAKTAKASKASFSLIHDEGLEIMKAFQVISEDKYEEYHSKFKETGEDNQHKYLPVPATYVINREGVIDYVYFDPNYKVRATAKDLLKHL